MASKEEILDSIAKMSVMDLVDLVKLMEDKFGVTAAAPVAVAAAGGGGAFKNTGRANGSCFSTSA